MISEGASDQAWLAARLTELEAVAGTVHRVQGEGLILTAAVNIPPAVAAAVAWVPAGKGMAGLALSRQAPVTTCNLQTDATGDVRPGARAVAAQAAAALPVLDGAGRVRAVVGFAYADDRALSPGDLSQLAAQAAALP